MSGSNEDLAYYTAEMVPWFWLLTRSANSRIFQQLSVPDIAEKIFQEKGILDYKLSLHATYEKRDYCVQYRETDFNFISRLLEDEGICYFFNHEKGKHTLVLADTVEDFKPCPKQEEAKYQLTTGGWLDEDVITGFEKRQKITASKYTHTDYNFKTPATDLKVEVASQQAIAPKELEIYDYPGEYDKRALGEKRSNVRIQEEEIKITTITGSSNCRAFSSGYRFKLDGYFREDMNKKPFVLAYLDHTANEEETYLSGSGSGEFAYVNNFTCTPFDVPYRSPRITPKPVMQGTQTAIVTGPSGEEIYTDEHGRVKVQFHWDREGKKDEKSSCWVRVSQASAGAGWGAEYIPRIGQEVIVDFLEGDPDKPIIIGRVYHGNNRPPTGLPAAGMVSGMKSNSTPGGGGYNQMTMDDTKGQEKITIHGQYNMDTTVENDQTLTVNNNRTSTIAVDDSETVGSNQTINVGSNQNVSIGADQSTSVGANQTTNVGANQSVAVGSAQSVTVGASKTETISVAKALSIGAAYQVSVGGAMNETVGAAKAEEIGGAKIVGVGGLSSENVAAKKSVNAGGSISEKAGSNISSTAGGKIDLSAGGNFTASSKANALIEASSEITLKCGGASIVLKSGGDITIKGSNITLDGSGKINAKAGGTMTLKGSSIKEN